MQSFRIKLVALALGLCIAATAAWADNAPAKPAPAGLPVAEFYAAKMDKPPTIDGNVYPGEWDRAVTISGFITAFEKTLQNVETTVSFGYDANNFYFLFDCPRGGREWRLIKTARQNDDYSYGDSEIEIWVSPPTPITETYQNVINTYPAVFDVRNIPSRGYKGMGWKGTWKIGVKETDDRYVIVASIPVKDFVGIDKAEPNSVWQLLFCRDCPYALSRTFASTGYTQGFDEVPQYPRFHMVDDEAVLQVKAVTSIFSGNYKFPMAVAAPKGAKADIDVELRWQGGTAPADGDKIDKQSFSLQAGERKEFTFEGQASGKGCVGISAKNKTTGLTVYNYVMPYVVDGNMSPTKPARPANAPPVKELDFQAMYGPGTNTLLVKADILDMGHRKDVAKTEMKLVDPATGKVLKTQAMPPFVEWYSNGAMSLDDVKDIKIPTVDMDAEAPLLEHNKEIAQKIAALKEQAKGKKQDANVLIAEAFPGDSGKMKDIPAVEPLALKVIVEAKDASGKILVTQDGNVSLKRYKAAWMDSTAGISDKVVPPWTPMTWADGTFGVWNRKVSVDGLGLAKKVDNGGTDQIAKMHYVAVVDGKPVEIVPSAPKMTKQTEAAIQLQGEGAGGGLKLSADTTAEFDGFVLTHLTIAPQGAAKVDGLYLEVVMPESEATHFCSTAGGWSAVNDETPAYWSSASTASGMLLSNFVPYVWLTNSDRAFIWFADSDKGWFTDDTKTKPTIELIRKDGTVTLRVHFIEVPTELKAATNLTWGYQTFPSRPLPAGWRTITCTNPTKDFPDAVNTYFWWDKYAVIAWDYYRAPYPTSFQASKIEQDAMFAKNPKHRGCAGSIAHSIGFFATYEGARFPEYVVDWGGTPGVNSSGDVTNCKGSVNFRLYNYERWVREGGLHGLYVDENYLPTENNFLTGNAYYRPDGQLERAYSYIGLRDLYKRYKIMCYQNNAPAPNLWQHITGGAAYYAWFGDMFFEGENVEPTNEQYDYIEVLPAVRMRAIGSSVCAGGTMTMMCQSDRHRTPFATKHTHQFVGWVLAHDVMPEQRSEFWPIAEEAHLYEANVEFLPYWKKGPITTATPDCIVSTHKAGKRAVLWIVNTAREDRTVDVAIDFAKLGFDPAKTKAHPAKTWLVNPRVTPPNPDPDPESVTLTPKGFSVQVLKRDYVAVHLVEE